MMVLTLQQLLHRYPLWQQRDSHTRAICSQLIACHTPALGGVHLRCEQCGHELWRYPSCRNRHCPQCQNRANHQWAEQQQASLLPVRYHHLVITLPHLLNGWVELHPDLIYRLLFQCGWATLKRFAANPKRLGGELGMSAVLHTWGQNLSRHVHLHCLIPGGVLTPQGEWKSSTNDYLFPVRALSRHIRGMMVSALRQAARQGALQRVTHPGEVDKLLDKLMKTEWVVYSKPCLQAPETVINYLSRYTHRTALTNGRLLGEDSQGVQLKIKDYRDHHRQKVIHLQGEEIVRRFLLHILPKGLMRVRHYGFLSNRNRRQKVSQIRKLLNAPPTTPETDTPVETDPNKSLLHHCPCCHQGQLQVIEVCWPLFRIKKGRWR